MTYLGERPADLLTDLPNIPVRVELLTDGTCRRDDRGVLNVS